MLIATKAAGPSRKLIQARHLRGGNTRHTRNMRCAHDAATAIRRAARTGRLGADDPELAAYAIFGVATILTAEFLHRRDGDPDAIADAVVTFCLRGIGAATPPRPVE